MRNNVVISIETDEKNHVFQPLDLFSDRDISLEYRSNLLSSLEDITCSSSYTIQVPHTLNNDSILDLAKVPSHYSNMTYKMIGCRVFVNGYDVTGPAWCYITESDKDSYSLVIVFGLMQNLGTWINDKPGLRDLEPRATNQNGDFYGSLLDGAIWLTAAGSGYWAGSSGYSRYDPQHRWSMYFGHYDCGVDDKTKCNIHPWISLREIYERIIRENNLSFSFPHDVLDLMENTGLVLTPMSKGSRSASSPAIILNLGCKYDNSYKMCLMQNSINDYITYGNFLHVGDGDVTIQLPSTDIYVWGSNVNLDGTNDWTYQDYINHVDVSKTYLMFVNGGTAQNIHPTKVTVGGITALRFTLPVSNPSYPYDTPGTPLVEYVLGTFEFTFHADVENADFYYFNTEPNSGFYVGTLENGSLSAGLMTTSNYQLNDVDYPDYGRYDLVKNLPDISQLDFIKAICSLYGLFPVVTDTASSTIQFVKFDKLFDNIPSAPDWSAKLIDTRRPSPKRISFTLKGYEANRNWIKYEVDDNEAYPNNDEGYIPVLGDFLEKDKTIVEFPWAATSEDRITQYRVNEETENVDFISCKYRIMAISGILNDTVQDYLARKMLTFPASLTVDSILGQRYGNLMSSVRAPKVITENFTLNEYDLKTLDFTKPVYLKKYGRYFAIISARWSSNSRATEVKLLML